MNETKQVNSSSRKPPKHPALLLKADHLSGHVSCEGEWEGNQKKCKRQIPGEVDRALPGPQGKQGAELLQGNGRPFSSPFRIARPDFLNSVEGCFREAKVEMCLQAQITVF